MAYDPLKDPMAQSILSATPPQAMIGPPSPPPPAAPFQLRPPQAPRLPGGGFDPAAVPPPMNFPGTLDSQFGGAPPAQPTVEAGNVKLSEGGGEFGESTDDAVDGAVQRQQLHDYILDLNPSGQKPSQFIRPEGDSYTSAGGERGKEWFEDATVNGPKRLEAAIRQSEEAQKAKSDELGKFYDKESTRASAAAAAMQHQRAADQVELQQRQANLDKATQFYTDDLADQGKFWTNPGNIVSAIAYSLLPIVSNDASLGVRMVNHAIDRDMANRQQAASGTLGALQSNLHGYSKIAGDRQAGDMLAESEARRIAAMEVERISQKFESPISKAKAQAIIEDLRMKSGLQRMEAYKVFGIHQDAKVMPKALHDARGQGFSGAWRKYGSDETMLDPALRQTTGASVNGTIAGTPSVATSDGSRPLSAQDAATFTSPKLTLHSVLGGRVPGGVGMADVFKRSVARQAAAEAGWAPGMPESGKNGFAAKKIEIMDKAEKDIQGFATQIAPLAGQKVGITNLQRDIDIISRSEKDPDDFLGKLRSMSPTGFAQWYENIKRQFGSAPKNSAQGLEFQKAEAAMRFRSLLADQQVQYYHEMAGANQAPGELANLSEVIKSASSFSQVRAFVNNKSMQLDKRCKEVLAGASNPLAAMLYMTQTGIGTTRLPSHGVPAPKRGVAAIPQMGMKEVNGMMGAPKATITKPGQIDFKGEMDRMFNTSSPRPAEPEPAPAPPPRRRDRI